MLTALYLPLFSIVIESSLIFISTPASINFDVNDSIWDGIKFLIVRFSPRRAPIITYVPASMRSGITSWNDLCR